MPVIDRQRDRQTERVRKRPYERKKMIKIKIFLKKHVCC